MFGISIFNGPQHFVSLAISLFTNKKQAAIQLQSLLHRTKNPPISIIYTYEFLKQKSHEQHSLDIIRFISQLSDLSQGYSVSTSLKDVIGESSFLTQVRHNLTHKSMISGQLIQISKDLILKELDQKYWQVTMKKYFQTFDIDISKIKQHYQRIYGKEIQDIDLNMCISERRKVTKNWLIEESTPYEFKEFVLSFLSTITSLHEIQQFFQALSEHKKAIALSKLIGKFLKNNKNEEMCEIIAKILKKQKKNVLKEPLILYKLKKLAFIHYLGYCRKILDNLDGQVKEFLGNFWAKKQNQLQKKANNKFNRSKIFNIYKNY